MENYKGQFSEKLLTSEFQNTVDGNFRQNLRQAMKLLKQEGYQYKNGVLHDPDGEKVSVEILNADPSFERILIPITSNFKKLVLMQLYVQSIKHNIRHVYRSLILI